MNKKGELKRKTTTVWNVNTNMELNVSTANI